LDSQATAPTNVGGKLKDAKGQAEDVKKESSDAPSILQVVGDNVAGTFLLYKISCKYTSVYYVKVVNMYHCRFVHATVWFSSNLLRST
jgi:hypothetical protein